MDLNVAFLFLRGWTLVSYTQNKLNFKVNIRIVCNVLIEIITRANLSNPNLRVNVEQLIITPDR